MREQSYAHINNIKINNQWRKIKRMTKVEDLKRNVEILAQNHEREVDRKDAIVQVTSGLHPKKLQDLRSVRYLTETLTTAKISDNSLLEAMQRLLGNSTSFKRRRWMEWVNDLEQNVWP